MTPGKLFTTLCPVTKQYLVPVNGGYTLQPARKLALHWTCSKDFSGLTTYGLKAYERKTSTPPMLQKSIHRIT